MGKHGRLSAEDNIKIQLCAVSEAEDRIFLSLLNMLSWCN